MSDTETKKSNFLNEFKAFVLIFMTIFGFFNVENKKMLYFMILASVLLIAVVIYIKENDLKFTKHFLNIIIVFYNITTLIFMVQYFIGGIEENKLFEVLLKPFYDGEIFNISAIIWIFVLTLFLQMLQVKSNRPSGENYGR